MPEATKTPRRNALAWIAWWMVDQSELDQQAMNYGTLGLFRSARGVAALFLLLSSAITAALTYFTHADPTGYIDVALFLVLAMFIYLGHRWAMIAAMLLWTFEKIFVAIEGFNGMTASPVIQILWWCIYMHAFYVAFRVEQRRRALKSQSPSPTAAAQ